MQSPPEHMQRGNSAGTFQKKSGLLSRALKDQSNTTTSIQSTRPLTCALPIDSKSLCDADSKLRRTGMEAVKSTLDLDLFLLKCPEHKKNCLVKVSQHSGKLYLMCSDKESCCNKILNVEVEKCKKHDRSINLKVAFVRDGKQLYYRKCPVGTSESKWCDSFNWRPGKYPLQSTTLQRETKASEGSGQNKLTVPTSTSSNAAAQERTKPATSTKILHPKAHQPPETVQTNRSGVKPESSLKTHNSSTHNKAREPKLFPAVSSQTVPISSNNPNEPCAIEKIAAINQDIAKKEKLLSTLKLSALPDNGAKIKATIASLKTTRDQLINSQHLGFTKEKSSIATAISNHTSRPSEGVKICEAQYLNAAQLREEYNLKPAKAPSQTTVKASQQQLTLSSAVEAMHKEIKRKPNEEQARVKTPDGINLELLDHQKYALAWMLWRENCPAGPDGGVLADDMGLGKTLTMISLIHHTLLDRPVIPDQSEWLKADGAAEYAVSNATLVIVPASVLHQWKYEIEQTAANHLNVVVYHGPSRTTSYKILAEADVVLTTYNLVQTDLHVDLSDSHIKDRMFIDKYDQILLKDGPLGRVKWKRIILDEAHQIKNARTKTTISICRLRATSRWAVTGTPIHNKLSDFYALVKYLRFHPFDDINAWRYWISNSGDSGMARLEILTKFILLRRTKEQLKASTTHLSCLPNRSLKTHFIQLSHKERRFYDDLFKEYQGVINDLLKNGVQDKRNGANVLVMILRLRQACCAPQLTSRPIEPKEVMPEVSDFDNILSSMATLNLGSNKNSPKSEMDELQETLQNCKISDKESSWKESCLEKTVISSKIDELVHIMESTLEKSSGIVKFVIVSQWVSFLTIIEDRLKASHINFFTIKGDVPASKRNEKVQEFNNRQSRSVQAMLVSLRAGGCGLNLIGGSHLFIMDLHWNPALEQQACDRIYRVGQTSDVVIHRFICKDTIEEDIEKIQDGKRGLADQALSSSGKLAMQDIRMIFKMTAEKNSSTRPKVYTHQF